MAVDRSRPVRRAGQTGNAKYNQLLRIEDYLGKTAVYENPFARPTGKEIG